MKEKKTKSPRRASTRSRERKNKLFYYLLIAYPVIQFCIFYIGVNMNSILLAFKQYVDISTDSGWTGAYQFVGLANVKQVLVDFFAKKPDGSISMLMVAFKNSVKVYLISLCVSTPLHIFFAYYIYKKKFGSTFFRIILFLPSVISPIVMAVMFQYFVNFGVPQYSLLLFNKSVPALLSLTNVKTTVFPTLVFYSIWVGFGTSILVYNGTMSGIDVSVTEAAKLDGATGLREFFNIVFPLIYPTFVTFFITGFAGIFTNQFNLFSFYGDQIDAYIQTLGFYLFKETAYLTLKNITYLSAMGVIMTCITVPLTLLLRRGMQKIGPSVE